MDAGDTGLQRVRAKAMKDGKEGWITPKGRLGPQGGGGGARGGAGGERLDHTSFSRISHHHRHLRWDIASVLVSRVVDLLGSFGNWLEFGVQVFGMLRGRVG